MFSWKRQRKEEPEAAPPPGSSPTAVVAAASVSAASSDADEAAEPATPAASCGSSSVFAVAPSAAGPGSSIELAARGSGTGGAAVAATSRLPLVLERASVRTKAAYFEALIHSNTTAHVVVSVGAPFADPAAGGGTCRAACLLSCGAPFPTHFSAHLVQSPQCTAEGTQHCSYPSSSGGDVSMLQPAYSSGDAIMLQPDSSGDEDEQGGFSEVHMVLRMPRGQPRPAVSGRYGGVAEMEALIEALQGQLELKEQQRKAAVDAYARRVRWAGKGCAWGGWAGGCVRSAVRCLFLSGLG